MEQKHIELPYKLLKKETGFFLTDNYNAIIAGRFARDADAEFVVRACNSYYDLKDDVERLHSEKMAILEIHVKLSCDFTKTKLLLAPYLGLKLFNLTSSPQQKAWGESQEQVDSIPLGSQLTKFIDEAIAKAEGQANE